MRKWKMPPGMVTTTPSVLSWAKSVPRRKTDWLIEKGVRIQFVEEGLTSLDGMGLLLLEGAYLFVEIEKLDLEYEQSVIFDPHNKPTSDERA